MPTSTRTGRDGWLTIAACLLIALGGESPIRTSRTGTYSVYSAGPTVESVIYSPAAPDPAILPADQSTLRRPTRASAGSPILIATLVHIDVLRTMAVARIGGLYGP